MARDIARRHVIVFVVVIAALLGLQPGSLAADDPGDAGVVAGLDELGLDQVVAPEKGQAFVKGVGRALVPATLVAREGDTPPGAPAAIATLNSPFTNGDGEVGFTGSAGENFVWFDTGIIWLSSSAPPGTVLTGAESTMGVGNNGEFVYSPAVNGNDAVWTHNGALLVEGTVPAPGYADPVRNTFNSRPHMVPSGASYWVAGISYSGGTASEGRVLYSSSDSTPVNIVPVLASDDLVGGLPIDRPSGVGFDFQVSDNQAHHIHELILDTGSTTNDDIVYVDGTIVARELSPTGGGDNWDNFGTVTINNGGDYLFSGDTDGATTNDAYVAFNGAIVVREGDTLAGVTLTSTASINALSVNNLDRVAFIWAVAGIGEVLFYACDASDLVGSSVELLRTADQLDLDAVPGADATVTDFNASTAIGPGLWLAEDGRVFVELDADFGAGAVEAIVALDTPPCDAVSADLGVTKTDSPDPVGAGALLSYAVAVTNEGPDEAPNVSITDTLPGGVSFVDASGAGWSCSEAGGTVSCAHGALAVGAAAPITLNVITPNAIGTITNTAVVASTASDPNSANNLATADTSVVGADLLVDLAGPASALPGVAVDLSTSVSNAGPAAAADAAVTTSLAAGLIFQSTTGCAEDPGGVPICTLGGLAPGGSSSFVVTAVVDQVAGGALSTSVSVVSTTPDPDGSNNSDSWTITVLQADWGDAGGVAYPTLFADNGARHAISASPVLGALIDAEIEGFPGANADGDDTNNLDDEDGVVFTSSIDPGTQATVEVTSSGAGLLLSAWIDFNGDGDWDDPDEQIFADQPLATGVNSLSFDVPAGAAPDITTMARFRASQTLGLAPSGPAPDGEVEDYLITTVPVTLQRFTVE